MKKKKKKKKKMVKNKMNKMKYGFQLKTQTNYLQLISMNLSKLLFKQRKQMLLET